MHGKCWFFPVGRIQVCLTGLVRAVMHSLVGGAEITVLAAQKKSFDKDERWQNLAPPGCNEVVLSRDQLVTSLRTNIEGKK